MTDEERKRIETHVDGCERGCKQAIAAFLDTNVLVPGNCETPPVSRRDSMAGAREEPLPDRVGRYRIAARLGAGGMGVVFRGHDPQLGRDVAVKVPRFSGSDEARAAARQRFVREAHAAAAVRHPNVCPIYDIGEQDGRPFVVMALVEGESLAEHLLRQGRFEDPRAAVALVLKVADALAAVHAAHIVHRDLKPGNILLDRAGEPYLTDFGLARSAESRQLTSVGQLVGTPAFMAPEQAFSELGAVGPHSDQYSLGVVLYQMLTGRFPFEGTAAEVILQIRSKSVPSPSQHRSDLEPALERVLLKSLAQQPQDRYGSVLEFAKALRAWHKPECDNSAPGRESVQASGPTGVVWTRRAFLGTLLAAAAGGAAWWRARPDLGLAEERFELELGALRAGKPVYLTNHSPGSESVASLSFPDYSSFVFLGDERIWDLRGFRQRGADDLPMTSAVNMVRYLRVAKTAEARELRFEGRTSGAELFLRCTSHADRAKEFTTETRGSVGKEFLKVRQVAVDVSDLPVGETLNVQLNSTMWDSLQTPAERWLGMIAYAGAAYLRMTILFPEDRPFTSHSLDVAPLGSREAPVSFRGQSMFLRDPSRTAIKWEIPNPIPNQVYRFSWQW